MQCMGNESMLCRFSSHPSTLMVRPDNACIDCAFPEPFYNHWDLKLQGSHTSSCHMYFFDMGNISGNMWDLFSLSCFPDIFSAGLYIRLQYLWEQVGDAVSFVETLENIIFSEAIKSQSLTGKINLFGEIESALVCCHWRKMPQTVSSFNKCLTDAQAQNGSYS